MKMEESVTYQAIVDTGMLKSARQALLKLGEIRLGRPNRKVVSRVERIADHDRLQMLLQRMMTADSWEELMA